MRENVSKTLKTRNLKHSKSACLLKSTELRSNFTYFAVTFQHQRVFFSLDKGAKPFLSGLLHFYSVTRFPLYVAKYTEGNYAPETAFIVLSKTTDFQQAVIENVVYSLNVNTFLTTGYSLPVFHLIE